jgi:peptidoglycan/xylan/chitin deacetylase (PgdA/CDA1 family)
MSREQVKACADHPLITIGGHTTSHPYLTTCKGKQLEWELSGSKQTLEEITGQRIDLFAYPTGDYNAEVLSGVKKTGYRAAFVEFSHRIGDPLFEIPRVGVYDPDPAYLSVKLSGLHTPALDPFSDDKVHIN